MTLVQRTHGRHQRERLAGGAVAAHVRAQRGDASQDRDRLEAAHPHLASAESGLF